MKIARQHFSKNITIVTLCFISCHILASEGPQNNRDQMFTETFNLQKERIMALPAYAAARNKYTKHLNEIAQYQALKIKEMQEDQEYQKNFADIKSEIQRSSELCKQNSNLSNAECEHLVTALTKQFIPT